MPKFNCQSIAFMLPVLIIPITTAVVVIPPTLEQLHQATLKQCRERDWPQHQAPQHEEFCRLYLAGKY